MSSWTREQPRVPTVTRAESAIAIGVVGVVMAAAAADGARTGGRSRFFQTALTGFGLHAFTHLGASALFRGYTPGVLTAPTIVLPYSVWAWRRLRHDGHWTGGGTGAPVWFPVAVGAAHLIARACRRPAGG